MSKIEFHPIDPSWGTPADTALHVVLVHPEIPGNTGNIARLCAGTGAVLHLVKPLGFKLEDRYVRRAGLDYWPAVKLVVHEHWDDVAAIFPAERMGLFTTKATNLYSARTWTKGTVLVFGRETKGLEPEIREAYSDALVKIPISNDVRSLNLSNAVAIAIYEVARQVGHFEE